MIRDNSAHGELDTETLAAMLVVLDEDARARLRAEKTIDAICIGILPVLLADRSVKGQAIANYTALSLLPTLQAARLASEGLHEDAQQHLQMFHELERAWGLPPLLVERLAALEET